MHANVLGHCPLHQPRGLLQPTNILLWLILAI